MSAQDKVPVLFSKVTRPLICPICDKIFTEPTTISSCLHTFCRKCITKKITKERSHICPVCNTYLGGAPLSKLRSDNNLNDIKLKLFPKKGKVCKDNQAEKEDLIPLSALRKHLVSSSSEPIQPPSPAEYTPSMGRKPRTPYQTLSNSSPAMDDSLYDVEVRPESPLPAKTRRNRRQISIREPEQDVSAKNNRKNKEPTNGDDDDMWIPLNRLVDVIIDDSIDLEKRNDTGEFLSERVKLSPPRGGSSSKLNASSSQQNISRRELFDLNVDISSQICELNIQQSIDEPKELGTVDKEPPPPSPRKNRSGRRKSKPKRFVKKPATSNPQANENRDVEPKDVLDNGDGNHIAGSSSLVKTRKSSSQKRTVASEEQNASVPPTVDSRSEGAHPVWFSLVPAPTPIEGGPAYPKISPSYMRVKNGNMPVSMIHNYLMKKLGLTSESEVEISVRGHPLNPSVLLHQVADWWLHTTPNSVRRQPTPGESAEDFVLTLCYGRKI
ncbi:hypothetical protein ACFE04_025102 [Oxalis oulophora]